MHIGMIMNKMQEEDNIKNKISQNKQKRLLTPQQTGIAAKPSDNSEISENSVLVRLQLNKKPVQIWTWS